MPDNVQSSGQSTPPLVDVTDGRAVGRLNRPREHNRLEPTDLTALRETSIASMRSRRSASWC